MRTWLYRLLSLVLGTAVALLLGEGVIRMLGVAPRLAAIEIDTPHGSFVSSPNPVLKYVPKPGARGVNAAGFLGRDYDVEKPPDTYRIVVLGDSIPYGYCNESRRIPLPLTFPEQLETLLARRPLANTARSEVLNFSVSGYDTDQEVELFEQKALAYDPDLVLLAYCLNDAMPSSRELYLFSQHEGWGAYYETANRLYRGAVYRSHLIRLIWASATKPSEPPDPFRLGPFAGPRRTIAGALERLESLSEQHGFRVLVVVFPAFIQLHDYPFLGHHEQLRAIVAPYEWDFVDLLPDYQRLSETTNDLCEPCCDTHPNELGHKITAEIIERRLRALSSR
jgi:lysophospholipase L1-like esterase